METFGYASVKATKPHECSNCGADIRVGTLYRRWVSADAGMLQTVRSHPRCAELWGEIGYDWTTVHDWAEFRQDCYVYGGTGPFPWESRYYET